MAADDPLAAAMDAMLEPPAAAVPEMPTKRTVQRRSRQKEPAFNEISVELSVVMGRASMPIHQLLKMGRGAVIELGASVNDDVSIYANNRLIARGQVVVVGENIAISITETVDITEI
jgi:flagellar motor switch protein FliN/FliY